MSFKAVIFDLFGTVVLFPPRLPAVQVGGTQWRANMGWLEKAVAAELSGVDFDAFLKALWAETEAIVRARHPEYVEVSSPERFRRALLRLDVADDHATRLGERLSLTHMKHLASTVTLPDDHRQVLAALSARFPLGLVSNFDHGPTARKILSDHGVESFFREVIISDGFGRRKPHPEIFEACASRLGIEPSDALYVGDSIDDDVRGAQAAGLSVAWIDEKGSGPPAGCVPDFILRSLPDVLRLDAFRE